MLSWQLQWFRGTYDPLRSIVSVFYDLNNADAADFDKYAVIFNHEYNHLIGTLGRHLQICLLDRYVSLGDKSGSVIENERAVIESFVPVWLSPERGWLTPSAHPKTVAPQCDPVLVDEIAQTCFRLKTCGWIMNGKPVKYTVEQILREIQQAILNTSTPGAAYSDAASRTSLSCLSEAARTLAGKTVEMYRTYRGEYYTDAWRVLDAAPQMQCSSAAIEECDMLELFLANTVVRECGLELKRYTLHERAELVLTWAYKMLRQNYSTEKTAEILAGIGSVFMPGVFLPFVAFWKESARSYRGEVHALPFGPVPLFMPKFTRNNQGQTEFHYHRPLKIFQLLAWPSDIRRQCSCELGTAMSDFCGLAVGGVTLEPFRERSSLVFSYLGDSIGKIARGLQNKKCNICSELWERMGQECCKAVSSDARLLVRTAGDHYATWISRHMERQFWNEQKGIPGGVHSVLVETDGNNFFRYE